MKITESKRIEQLNTEIAERDRERRTILREVAIRELGGEKELRKAEKKRLKETDLRFASAMGFGDDLSKQGRRILREGRGAFRVDYNSREHGRRPDGVGMGTLPPAA